MVPGLPYGPRNALGLGHSRGRRSSAGWILKGSVLGSEGGRRLQETNGSESCHVTSENKKKGGRKGWGCADVTIKMTTFRMRRQWSQPKPDAAAYTRTSGQAQLRGTLFNPLPGSWRPFLAPGPDSGLRFHLSKEEADAHPQVAVAEPRAADPALLPSPHEAARRDRYSCRLYLPLALPPRF